jgi:hypothetical protein
MGGCVRKKTEEGVLDRDDEADRYPLDVRIGEWVGYGVGDRDGDEVNIVVMEKV